MIRVLFNNRQDELEITKEHKNKIRIAIRETLKAQRERGDFEVSVSFVSNDEIQSLNKDYRNKDSITDVLSFPLDDVGEDGYRILGDIVLSTKKIIEQALEFNHSFDRELIYMVVHSMLHLLGYDHMKQREKIEMRSREKLIMQKLKLFK